MRVGEGKTFAFSNIMKPIAKKIKPTTKFFSEILARIKLILENKCKANTLMYLMSNQGFAPLITSNSVIPEI